MNAGATSERVYDTLKRRLLEHRFLPGERLEPATLAESVTSSVTPVRETLHVLAGEQLLDTRSGGGFYVPFVNQPGLSDLYAFSADILAIAIRSWSTIPATFPGFSQEGPAHATRSCFDSLAQASRNPEHAFAVRRLSDRLNAARLVEPSILGDPDVELADIRAAAIAGDRAILVRRIGVFHRRRIRHAAGIVRALYRRD